MGQEKEKMRQENERLKRKNRRLEKKLRKLTEKKQGNDQDEEVAETDNEEVEIREQVQTGVGEQCRLLLPTTSEYESIDLWRKAHQMTGSPVNLQERFRRFMSGTFMFLIDGKHVLITNIRHVMDWAENIREFAPVVNILCTAADPDSTDSISQALGMVIHPPAIPYVFKKAFILTYVATNKVIETKGVPSGPITGWSLVIPNAKKVEELQRVAGFANK